MNKFVIYILVLLLNINNLFFQQIIKLPVLFQHYSEHKQRDEQTSVLDFLTMHYCARDLNDNDDFSDNQLPFKSINFHYKTAFIFLIPEEANHFIQTPYHFIERVYCKLKELSSDAHLKLPFRPPVYIII